MNTQRSIFATICAALLPLLAAPTALGDVYNLETQPTVLIDTVDGKMFATTEFTKTTGTGVIDPFLSIQAGPTESGYNVSSGVLDTKRNGQYTRTQMVSDLQIVTAGGVQYYAFLIDINEPNNVNSVISIDTIRLYTSSNLITDPAVLLAMDAKFDMDSGPDTNVTLLYDDLNSGSGQGDVAIFIPVAALAGVAPTDYFYLYQEFGGYGGAYSSDSGFEETRHGGDVTFVPIPETNAIFPILAVLGVVVAGPFVRRCFHP